MSNLMEYVKDKVVKENKDSSITIGYGEDEYGPYTSFTKQSKYYTPSIEEFHVGFECESNYILVNNSKDTSEFITYTFTEDNVAYMLDAYTNDAYPTEFRVKYLDKEDIESLGWHLDSKVSILDGPLPYYIFDKDGYEINLFMYENPDKRLLRVYKIVKDDLGLEYARHLRFSGNIKNKSELKVLLKQLNLNNK